jgi:hypothetical protein
MKKGYLILIIISIFVVSLAARYYPIFHKGFSYSISSNNLILARNLSVANKYSFENEKNVVLSSSLVEERGIPSATSNKLTPVIYGKIFNVFGFNSTIPLYISLFLYALTTVLLFLLVLKLFTFKIALIVAGVDIFMPFVLAGAIRFGFYEWAMLFFIIAISVYLWRKKPSSWRLLLSGLFFGSAALARNAFLISFIPFVVYDLYSNFIHGKDWRRINLWIWPAIKRAFVFILPVVLLWGGIMIYDFSQGTVNAYFVRGDVGYDVHLFLDPYTYHFEKETFIEQIRDSAQGDEINALISYGYFDGWKVKAKMHIVSLVYYIKNFLRLPTLGGALVIFFLILGAIFLYIKKRQWFNLFVLWGIIWFFSLTRFRTTNAAHFLEVRFPLVILMSLGVYMILKFIWQSGLKSKTKHFLIIGLLLVVLFHLIHADRWMLHESYENSNMEETFSLAKSIEEKKQEINKRTDVIAVGGPDNQAPTVINWYTDFSCVYFNSDTVEKLLEENKLRWAFNEFGVTHVVGFDSLNKEIANATDVKIMDLE